MKLIVAICLLVIAILLLVYSLLQPTPVESVRIDLDKLDGIIIAHLEAEKVQETANFEEFEAVVTAYNPEIGQTDADPETMASGRKIYASAVACPRRYQFGTQVEIAGRVYTCEDRLNIKYDDRFDILMFDKTEAKNFGKQLLTIKVYD